MSGLLIILSNESLTGLKNASPFIATLVLLVGFRSWNKKSVPLTVSRDPDETRHNPKMSDTLQFLNPNGFSRANLPTVYEHHSIQSQDIKSTYYENSFGDEASDRVLRKVIQSGIYSRDQIAYLRTLIGEELKPAPTPLIDFEQGDQFSEFKIESLIRKGGGAAVYRAIAGNGEKVALKILSRVEMKKRFDREMDLVQRLAHPNIVTAYETGEVDGASYISMELLDGPDLNDRVIESGTLDWQTAYTYILQIARGLKQAHDRGLIHRDIKPANIIEHGGRVKLADLGVASIIETPSNATEEFVTQSRAICGTPAFMAPEQASSTQAADERSDIYGLGVTWHFLMTGEEHIEGNSIKRQLSNLVKNRNITMLDRSQLPDPLWAIYSKMVCFEPHDRYRSIDELLIELEAFGRAQLAIQEKVVRILLVEDSDFDLRLACELLKRINQTVSVESATTLKQAVEAVAGQEFDIILLDLALPDSDGIDTVKRMKAAANTTPVVVLSGHQDEQIKKDCLELGAREYACKKDLNAHLLERIVFMTISRIQRVE